MTSFFRIKGALLWGGEGADAEKIKVIPFVEM